MMNRKHNIRLISILASLVLGISTLSAQEYQNTPVEISTEKVKVNGKVCYSHIVLEKQTLYSISKAYEVSLEDLYQLNPKLKTEGLKKNSIILIPVKQSAQQPEKTKPSKKEENKKFSEVLTRIKEKKNEPAPTSDKAPRLHSVRWYEDLESISETYGVSIEIIMAANNLEGRKLSRGQKLIIPYPEEIVQAKNQNVSTGELLGSAPVNAEPSDSTYCVLPSDFFTRIFVKRIPVKTTVVLPLTAEDGSPNRNNIDFYCGVLLAVYNMAEKGIDCNLNVYDMMDSEAPVSIENIIDSDLIIGPVSTADLTRMVSVATNAKAIISPLDQRAEELAKRYTNIFQIPTPHKLQYNDLTNWMAENTGSADRVILITEKGARQTEITNSLISNLANSGLDYQQYSYSILEGRDVTTPLTVQMTPEGINKVLVASESEAFVNDVVRNLNLLAFNGLNIELYAPSKIKGFETIEVDNLHNTSLHLSLGYNIEYDTEEVKNFLMKYRALFNTEPSQFAFQGYDITSYFMELCSQHGAEWKEHVVSNPKKMLQSTFCFRKEPFGGYINTGIRRISFGKEYSIEKKN